jgi:hypothetical protein
MEGTASA